MTERYISKYLNLRLVNKASHTKEVDGRVVTVPGNSIRFVGGVYETSDPAEIEFLDNHPNAKNGVFIKLDKKTKNAIGARADQYKDLEQRQKELDAREAEINRREKKLGKEEGASGDDEDEDGDGLDDMNKTALLEVAQAEGVELPSRPTMVQIIEAIRAKRASGDKPEF